MHFPSLSGHPIFANSCNVPLRCWIIFPSLWFLTTMARLSGPIELFLFQLRLSWRSVFPSCQHSTLCLLVMKSPWCLMQVFWLFVHIDCGDLYRLLNTSLLDTPLLRHLVFMHTPNPSFSFPLCYLDFPLFIFTSIVHKCVEAQMHLSQTSTMFMGVYQFPQGIDITYLSSIKVNRDV